LATPLHGLPDLVNQSWRPINRRWRPNPFGGELPNCHTFGFSNFAKLLELEAFDLNPYRVALAQTLHSRSPSFCL